MAAALVAWAWGTRAGAATYATPTYVQSDAGTCPANVVTCSWAYTRPVSAGNVLIASILSGPGDDVASVTDSLGDRWEVAARVYRADNADIATLWYTPVPCDGGLDIVTAALAYDAGVFTQLDVYEYSGLAADALDCWSSSTTNSAVAESGFCTTTSPTELLFAFVDPRWTPSGPGPGFTLREFPSDNGDEDGVVTALGTYEATFPLTDAGGAAVMLLGTFRAAELAPDGGAFAALPLASVSPAFVTVDAGDTALFDGTASTPSTGASLISYEWLVSPGIGGAPVPAGDGGATLSFSPPAGGVYVVELIVMDSSGERSLPAWAQVNARGGLGVSCDCAAGAAPWGQSLWWAAVVWGAWRARFRRPGRGFRARATPAPATSTRPPPPPSRR